jgi:2-succinyl-5-enolpyruvyl-6-hydroxy-3-cyclohexene-1-carboxylate synthase
MYTKHISAQILISALKQYNVHNIVLSPGGSDVPLVHSIESDSFFTCYSVVDERSAVYFGIGVSQIKNEPVACICTSGTAVCNYLPGMTEAYYQNIPIIAITADKNPYFTGQIETQKIEQRNIFGGVSKKSVELPLCNTEDEIWYCERLIKEALLASMHQGKGPVHLNIPLVGSYTDFSVKELPKIRPLKIITCEDTIEIWQGYFEIIKKAQKILVVIGQNVVFEENGKMYVEKFFEKFNCVFAVEHLSNLKFKGTVNTYPITETGNTNSPEFIPDLVISLGNNLSAYELKPFLRVNRRNFRHIAIDEGGRIRDVYKALTDIFQCSPVHFFKYFSDHASEAISNNMNYYTTWKDAANRIKFTNFEFSNFYVAQKIAKNIPENAVLHLAILNSIRVMQFFDLPENVRVFSNVGALGIDGCLSTFMGHASVTANISICLIGDLSFFYDMNAAGIKHVGNNVRIILLNNGGGAEFHFFMSKKEIPTINDHICAAHKKTAKGWIESLGYRYYTASSKDELDQAFITFFDEANVPKFLEVFTDMEEDARLSRELYIENQHVPNLVNKIKNKIKGMI